MRALRFSLLTFCLTTLTLFAASGADARGMTAWDVAQMQSVGSVAISPDGRFIAYTVSVPRIPMEDENGRAWTELHVYDREAETSRAFITGEVNVSSIKWTRDGQYIGYRAKRNGDEKTAVYVIPVAGGESRRVLTSPTGIQEYAFCPGGARIAFTATEEDSEGLEALEEQGFDMEVYEENAKPWRLFIAGVDLERGTADEPEMLPIAEHIEKIAWAAEADHILATLAPSSRIDDEYMARQWAVIDAGSGTIVGRIETEGKLGSGAISPNGERVAFIGPDSIHDPSAGRLMVGPATGGAPAVLLGREFEGEVQDVRWLDDEQLLVLADEGVHAFVAKMSADGGKLKKLTKDVHPVVTAVDVSADGKVLAARAESPAHPSELFTAKLGKDLERVTDLNPWLADIELAEQRVIEYPARDGLMIQGVLIEPLGKVEGQRYPMIVVVHGGPEAHEKDGWKTYYSRVGQYAAAEGFAVFYPNYRGSTGRGVEFTLLSQGDPGGAEFDDVVDGVDYLVETGLVDEKRVGINGGSYGGYASAWGATYYSDRYAAAVMFVGISEQFSKFGTTDIPQEMYLVHSREWPWENWELFEKSSPIRYAERARTPILIMHGDSDPRVDPRQSEILYRYLVTQDDPPPARLVFYKGEGHGNRRAASRYDYSLRMMRWMNHYLMGPGGEPPPPALDYDLDIGEAQSRGRMKIGHRLHVMLGLELEDCCPP
jgi:dipeptidyl aminopeptidase/acylaminoacyl peptidase